MALPEAVEEQPIIRPPAAPTNIQASLRPAAGLTDSYLGGYAGGGMLVYHDVTDFVWWEPLNLPDRIRSHFNTTLGQVLVGTPQADVAASEVVPRGDGYSIGDQTDYASMARPLAPFARMTAISDQGGSPAHLQPVTFETALSHLNRLFPSSTYASAMDAIGESTMTAQQVIQYLFDQWEAQFPGRFRARPAPPMILFVQDEEGRYTRTLTTDRVHLRNPPERRRSIQTLLEDLRQAFPGYGVTVDHEGYVVLLPPPWAMESEQEEVAAAAYRIGPGSWLPTPEEIQAVGREDVTSSPWDLDPAYDGTHLEVRLHFRTRAAIDAAGESNVLDIQGNITSRTVTLAPNNPQVVEYTFQVGELENIFTVRYLVTWNRPGSVGGNVIVTPTQALTSFPVPEAGVTLYFAHSALLDALSIGALGVPVVNVTGDEVVGTVPQPAYDASRVINAQRATWAELGFVDDQQILALTGVRVGPTAFDPPGAGMVEANTFQPFLDDDDEPMVTGSIITVTWSYWMRGSASLSGPTGEQAFAGPITGTAQVMVGGASVVNIVLPYPWSPGPTPTYWVARLQFRYAQDDRGRFGIVAGFAATRERVSGLTPTPFLGHVMAFTVDGSVFAATGVELDVEYSVDSLPEDAVADPDVALSTARFGRREGRPLAVNFFSVTEQDLVDMVRAIALYHAQPRAVWRGVQLTSESDLDPRALGHYLLLPWGSTAVFETYDNADARAYMSSSIRRSIDAVEVYRLILGGSGVPGADTDDFAVEFAHGWDGVSWDLDEGHIPDPPT